MFALWMAGFAALGVALGWIIYLLEGMRRSVRQLERRIKDAAFDGRRIAELLGDEHWRRVEENPRYQNPRHLVRHAWQVNSQSGEDGILREIFRRLGAANRTFVEIGVDGQLECNTAFLLAQGWRGLWVDGDEKNIARAAAACAEPVRAGRLRAAARHVTRENINDVLREFAPPAEPDLFSLDIDRNTYWVWAGLELIRPRVVVVEYNAHFGPELDWKVAYDAAATFDHSMNFGASLKAFELLGRAKGYCLVGCEYRGLNAFFVRADLVADKFCEPFTAEHHFEPIRWHLIGAPGHKRAYCGGATSP